MSRLRREIDALDRERAALNTGGGRSVKGARRRRRDIETKRYVVAPGIVADLCDDCWLPSVDSEDLPRDGYYIVGDDGATVRLLDHDEYVAARGGLCRAHTEPAMPGGKAAREHIADCDCD